jgi:oligosaccharyltransferase complex subunit beta
LTKSQVEVLTGSPTAYSHNPDSAITDYPHTVGTATLLIAALQARNNARVMFFGSLDFFSNDFFEARVEHALSKRRHARAGNEQLCEALTQWLFKERGVLRVGQIRHNVVGEKGSPKAYTIKQNLVRFLGD